MSEPVPGIFQKATNFAKAVVKHAATGFQRVPLNVFQERLSICNTCENKTPEGTCKLCGCYLNIKNTWASEKCPANKWDIYTNNSLPPNISTEQNHGQTLTFEKVQEMSQNKNSGGCGCGKKTMPPT